MIKQLNGETKLWNQLQNYKTNSAKITADTFLDNVKTYSELTKTYN